MESQPVFLALCSASSVGRTGCLFSHTHFGRVWESDGPKFRSPVGLTADCFGIQLLPQFILLLTAMTDSPSMYCFSCWTECQLPPLERLVPDLSSVDRRPWVVCLGTLSFVGLISITLLLIYCTHM